MPLFDARIVEAVVETSRYTQKSFETVETNSLESSWAWTT